MRERFGRFGLGGWKRVERGFIEGCERLAWELRYIDTIGLRIRIYLRTWKSSENSRLVEVMRTFGSANETYNGDGQ